MEVMEQLTLETHIFTWAPTDVSFSYDFLLYFGDSEVHFSPYVSPVLYCFLMTSEHALLIQEDELR